MVRRALGPRRAGLGRDTPLNAHTRWLAFLLALLMTLLLGAAACEPAGGVPSALARRRARAAAFRPPEVAIELQRGTEPRELVRIGTRGVVIGPADGRLEWKFFA